MKTTPLTGTLFQTAARMEIPADQRLPLSKPALTGETFAQLRLEATMERPASPPNPRSGVGTTHLPVSFDTVRLTVFIHSLARTPLQAI